jgi:hypothetical protein
MLGRQALYTLSHSTSLVFNVGYFQYSVSRTVCLGWLQTAILLISMSWVARITGISHWRPAQFASLLLFNLIIVFNFSSLDFLKKNYFLNFIAVCTWVCMYTQSCAIRWNYCSRCLWKVWRSLCLRPNSQWSWARVQIQMSVSRAHTVKPELFNKSKINHVCEFSVASSWLLLEVGTGEHHLKQSQPSSESQKSYIVPHIQDHLGVTSETRKTSLSCSIWFFFFFFDK